MTGVLAEWLNDWDTGRRMVFLQNDWYTGRMTGVLAE
jgi:hypothetical protein